MLAWPDSSRSGASMSHRSRHWRAPIAISAALLAIVAVAPLASAEPATTVGYPAWASATRYTGQAFDTCTAPPLATMQAWAASPYRGVGVYVGGQNRTCAQPELTSTWVRAVADLSWRLIPIYKALHPPSAWHPPSPTLNPS